MNYSQTTPCNECPFLKSMSHAFTVKRLREFANEGCFPCHKSAELNDEGNFIAKENSVACAGALIFNEKRKSPNQMMRIAERLGIYDYTKLNMKAEVR